MVSQRSLPLYFVKSPNGMCRPRACPTNFFQNELSETRDLSEELTYTNWGDFLKTFSSFSQNHALAST